MRRHRLVPALTALLLAGCVVVPQTVQVYDPDCRVHTRQITLETAVLGGFHSCSGDGCAAMLATMGFVTAASLVISGSIAIVGNVVYWAEKQGRCQRGKVVPQPEPLNQPAPFPSPTPPR